MAVDKAALRKKLKAEGKKIPKWLQSPTPKKASLTEREKELIRLNKQKMGKSRDTRTVKSILKGEPMREKQAKKKSPPPLTDRQEVEKLRKQHEDKSRTKTLNRKK